MSVPIRVRFAPSPTGYLHVGGARTALFNYLFSRRFGGTFILRIEDTDRSRYQEEALKEIYTSLRWLGLQWDEGPEVGGECGSYVQSERLGIYSRHIEQLLLSGHAYRCFCTQERLEEVRKLQEQSQATQGAGYDRKCRDLDPREVERLMDEGMPHTIRFKIPLGRPVVFQDMIRGQIEYRSDILDDLVLMKSDGFPTYHFANVVDDHTMRITHVLRGDEWIASTPRHVLIYEAFGWQMPQFAHMPVILSPSGGKLSKRKGAASVMDYKRSGYLPDALFNFLALLGWAPGDDREIMTREEMIQTFTLEKVSPKAAVFDEQKLEWMNGQYLQTCPIEAVLEAVVARWKELGALAPDASVNTPYLRTVIALMKIRSRKIGEIADSSTYFLKEPETYDPDAAQKHFKPDAAGILMELIARLESTLVFDHATLEAIYHQYAEHAALSSGKLIHPTRLALSGVSVGPGLFEMMEVLGKDRVLQRMHRAVEWLGKNTVA
jgi:glutamyl-tRNA synthetase